MPHVPFFIWAELCVTAAVAWLILTVEAKIVRPSIEEEQERELDADEYSFPDTRHSSTGRV